MGVRCFLISRDDPDWMDRNYEPGAMWLTPGAGHLVVRLPNYAVWDVDARSDNCTMPDDDEHRCWVRHGEPPDVTVDKDGLTCQAGAGSIACGDYHGFLRGGELVTA